MQPLRFATYLAPNIRPLYEFAAAACSASRLIDGDDWRELADGHIDVAFVCSPPLIWLGGSVEAIAAPVLTDPRFAGQPLYSSEVVVSASSGRTSLDDLRGVRWAYNEPSSWSGYWVTLAHVGSWRYFDEVVAAGSHQRALRMVAGGEVDGSAIDSQVLAVELRDHPELAECVRVVDTLGPSPIQPVVVRADLDPELKQAVRAQLLSLRGDELDRHFVKGFAPAPDYSPIAEAVGRLQDIASGHGVVCVVADHECDATTSRSSSLTSRSARGASPSGPWDGGGSTRELSRGNQAHPPRAHPAC